MSYLNDSPETLANLMRLKGLRGLGNRKTPQPSYSALDTEAPDLALTSMQEEVNVPMADEAGGYMPESYDVRANEVITEEPPQEQPSIFQKIGQAFGSLLQKKSPSPMEETTPLTSPEAERSMPMQTAGPSGFDFRALAGPAGLLFSKENFKPELGPEFAKTFPEVAETLPQFQSPEQKQADFMNRINLSNQAPWNISVYGATDEVAKQPALQDKVREYAGINWTPIVQEKTQAAEKVMADIDKNLEDLYQGYTEDEVKLRKRIDQGLTSDSDKISIGLALLMPLLIGGFFGAEAGLGALAGGAKGIGDIYAGREKSLREDEESLREIQKLKSQLGIKRGELELKKQTLPETIKKGLPEEEKAFLKGRKEVRWIDPETQKERIGFEIRPDLVALPEYLNDKEDLKTLTKAATDLSEVKSYTDELNDLTADVIEIVSQLDNKNAFSKLFTAIVSKTTPGSLSKLTQDVEFEGRKVNAGQILEQKLGFLANAYAQAKSLGQLDRAAQSHIEKILLNPTKTLNTPEDAVNQMLEVRKLAQNGLIRSTANAGFAPEFLIRNIGERNRSLYGRLNKKEEKKATTQEKKELSRKG